jgi:hypothetical protein
LYFTIQEIFDIGTYEELVERRTIPDYLYSDDEDEDIPKNDESTNNGDLTATNNGDLTATNNGDLIATSNGDLTTTNNGDLTTSSKTTENGGSTNPFRRQMEEEEKMKRNRRKSIHKFIREQKSIDDDIGKTLMYKSVILSMQ